MFKRFPIFLTAVCFGIACQAASAEEVRNHTNYTIALSGLPLANAFFQTRKAGEAYTIDAQIASTGLGHIISEAKAEMSSAGAVKDGQFQPQKFSFRYKYGKRTRSFETRFADTNVVSSVIEPKPRKRRKGWVDIKPEDLLSVTDPIAGLVIPLQTEPCRADIAVYDGESRLSLKLARKGEKAFVTEGFKGDAVVCSLRYEPKSGYRKGKNDIEYVRKLNNMEIWFAKSTAMNVYAPVFLSVPTKFGTLTIRATRFEG